jgi:hypothetical protein
MRAIARFAKLLGFWALEGFVALTLAGKTDIAHWGRLSVYVQFYVPVTNSQEEGEFIGRGVGEFKGPIVTHLGGFNQGGIFPYTGRNGVHSIDECSLGGDKRIFLIRLAIRRAEFAK